MLIEVKTYYLIFLAMFFVIISSIYSLSDEYLKEEIRNDIVDSIYIFDDENYEVEIVDCAIKIARKNNYCEHPVAVSEVYQKISLDEIDLVELIGSRNEYKTIFFKQSQSKGKSYAEYLRCDGSRIVSHGDLELSLLVKGNVDRNLIRNIESFRKECSK